MTLGTAHSKGQGHVPFQTRSKVKVVYRSMTFRCEWSEFYPLTAKGRTGYRSRVKVMACDWPEPYKLGQRRIVLCSDWLEYESPRK